MFRLPTAVGRNKKLVGAGYRLSAKLSNVTLWRERSSVDLMRVGRLALQTAFDVPRSVVKGRFHDFLLASMRGCALSRRNRGLRAFAALLLPLHSTLSFVAR